MHGGRGIGWMNGMLAHRFWKFEEKRPRPDKNRGQKGKNRNVDGFSYFLISKKPKNHTFEFLCSHKITFPISSANIRKTNISYKIF